MSLLRARDYDMLSANLRLNCEANRNIDWLGAEELCRNPRVVDSAGRFDE